MLLICSYVVSTAAAQLIGRQTSMFMLNLYRYGFLMVMAIVWSSLLKFSVHVEKKDLYRFVIAILFNYIKSTLFFISAAYLPLGNLAAVFTGLYLFLSAGVDFMFKGISKVAILVFAFTLIGVTLVLQPWQLDKNSSTDSFNRSTPPCVLWGNVTVEGSNSGQLNMNSSEITVDVLQENYWIKPVLLGYICIIVAAVSATISSSLSRSILQVYNVYCFFFWAAVFQSLMSGVMVIVLKLSDDPTLSVPADVPCLGFTMLFLCATVIHGICCTFVFIFLPLSQVALGKPCSVLLLYIGQLTLFHRFYPGLGNIPEIIGITLIIIASLFSPVISEKLAFCRNRDSGATGS